MARKYFALIALAAALMTTTPVLAWKDGIVDKTNHFIVQPDFAQITYSGRGIYQCLKERNGNSILVDHNGKPISTKIPSDCNLIELILKRPTGKAISYVPADSLFIVSRDKRQGILDARGKTIVPIEFQTIETFDHKALFHLTKKSSEWPFQTDLYFDPARRRLSKTSFDRAKWYCCAPSETIIPFCKARELAPGSNLWGAFDIDANIVIPQRFKHMDPFAGGITIAQTEDGASHYIDTKGKILAPNLVPVLHFNDGLVLVKKLNSQSLLGVVNRRYHFVIPPIYYDLRLITKHAYAGRLAKKGPYIAISRSGKRLFEFPENVVDFEPHGGDLIVARFDNGIPPPQGMLMRECVYNESGTQLVPPNYGVSGASHGFIVVIEYKIITDRLSGVMNSHGKFIIPMESAYFVATEPNRLIKTVRNPHFNQDDWFSHGRRFNDFAHFLKDYDLIGMPRKQVHELLGDPQQSGKTDQYEILSGNGIDLNIEFKEEKVWRWRLSHPDDSTDIHWISENMIFDPDIEPKDKLIPKPIK